MRALPAIGATILVAALLAASSAHATTLNDPIDPCWRQPAPTLRDFARFSGKVWSRHLWRRGAPPQRAIAAAAFRQECAASSATRHAMARRWARDRRAYGRWRALRKIAPYYFGEPMIPYVVIPPYVVRCETQGYYGPSRWTAANPSGAVGPYQLLGKGAPFPADTWRERMENHRIALHVLRTEGPGAWSCW